MTTYESGCTSHCNQGRDCTCTHQICATPRHTAQQCESAAPEGGNFYPQYATPGISPITAKEYLPLSAIEVLLVSVVLLTVLVCFVLVAGITTGFAWGTFGQRVMAVWAGVAA